MEKAHEVAYREVGLGRSLYAPLFMMNEFSPDLLREFVSKNFSSERFTLAALGPGLDELMDYASEYFALPSQSDRQGSDTPAKFYGGGEARENTEDVYAYTLLMGEGARYAV